MLQGLRDRKLLLFAVAAFGGFTLACSGGSSPSNTSGGPQSSPSGDSSEVTEDRVDSEFEIDNWEPNGQDDLDAFYLAMQIERYGSIQTVDHYDSEIGNFDCSFRVVDVIDSRTLLAMQLDGDRQIILLSGINTSRLVDGDERQMNGVAGYEGIVEYETVLGGQSRVHHYRFMSDSIEQEARRLARLMEEKNRVRAERAAVENETEQAEREQRIATHSTRQELRGIIEKLRENISFEGVDAIRATAAQRFEINLRRVDEAESLAGARDLVENAVALFKAGDDGSALANLLEAEVMLNSPPNE